MRNATVLKVLFGIAALAVPALAVETAPAPAGEVDLARCLADPPEWAGRLDSELAKLNKAVESAAGPVEQATAHLAAANWLVGVPTSRAAVRWLAGMERPQDLTLLASRADQAAEHLDKGRAALKSVGQAKASEAARIAELKLAADSLEPFIKLLAVAGEQGDAEKRKSGFSEAALGLAMARESDDPDLSACALLWQSFAWECAGRRERALLSLPHALTRPEQPSFGFLSRLLRCRLVAEDERYAASFALALRVRAACNQWFPKETSEQLASRGRLAAVVQYEIGRSWLKQLTKSGSKAAADDVEALLAGLRDALYEQDAPGPVYVPESIVPILVESPVTSAPAAVSRPAGTPASGPASMPTTAPIITE